MGWDATLGVWEGNAALASAGAVPDPLWIFGYGSLCWKADFPHDESFVGRVYGWRRFFAQRSTDHRGTPEASGLVATLLSEEQCVSFGVGTDEPASCVGMCYRVSKESVESVLSQLDFREKGGYSRSAVDVLRVGDGEAGAPAPVRALLYTATPDNPGFDRQVRGAAPPLHARTSLTAARAQALLDLDAAAATISRAIGPSGSNREYLLELSRFLHSVGERDDHIESLVARLSAPPS